MLIIGCDFHPSMQQVAMFDKQTGEIQQQRLSHREPAEEFYRGLAEQAARKMFTQRYQNRDANLGPRRAASVDQNSSAEDFADLCDVVGVMTCHVSRQLTNGNAATLGMNAKALPLFRCEALQEGQV